VSPYFQFDCFVFEIHKFHQNLKAELDFIRKSSWNITRTLYISKKPFNAEIITRDVQYLHEIWASYSGSYEYDSLTICDAM
jgi:hypothetical protein